MDYRQIIESRYNRKNWQELLFDIFRNKAQFWQQPQRVPVDESMAKSAYYTSKITLPDGHTIAIYEVELSDSVVIERNRAGIRNLLCTNWRGMGCSGAFMFCFRQHEAVLRFSYVSEAFTFADDGSLKKDSTDTKRFTYLLGEGHRSRTAIQQFEKLKASGLTLKDITKAFSVEALSDLFFKEYKKQYEDIIEFVTGKRMVKVANKWEERITGEPCREIMQEFCKFSDAEKAVRDYVKKLMGRLVFIQFLQKKGWMGCSAGEAWNDGDREFVQNLFANTTHKNTFVDDVLEPLFNDINTRRPNDIANAVLGTGIKVPYLNGGLFEHDDYDKTAFPLPAKYMKSLLDFFASYNFTIDENDPDDAEIGVDPEMLGRIFENLLEDNKDKGAFYTPKEIVQYMCRESLIAYLQTDEEDEAVKLQIREFVTTNNAKPLSADLSASIDQKLKEVKICDPAIGSGAFPMGLLRELYACRKAIEGIDDETAVRIKTEIIQNNIYGVDIEKGAVDIARLRFWLALIVDEKTPHALPNMDFKIMQGNSLLEQYEGIDLSKLAEGKKIVNQKARIRGKKYDMSSQTEFVYEGADAMDNIQTYLRDYFSITDHQKKEEYKNCINKAVHDFIRVNIPANNTELAARLENLPIPNDKFFLWHIYFKEVFDKGGFDIVIGNPPYVNIANIKDNITRKLYQNRFQTVKNKSDLYSIFTEHAYNILKEGGVCSYIFSNSWMGTDSFSLFRSFLVSRTRIEKLVDLPDKVFENASVRTCIIIYTKNLVEEHSIVLSNYDGKSFTDSVAFLKYSDIKKYEHLPFSFEKNINLQQKECIRLGDIADFTLGIKTSNDKKFISNLPFKEDSYRLIRGRNINRYSIPLSEEWIWYRPDLFMEKVGAGPRKLEYFLVPQKIIIQDVAQEICATIDREQHLCNDTLNVIYNIENNFNLEYILAILNSRAVRFWHKKVFPEGLHIKKYQLETIPIPVVSLSIQEKIADKVNCLIEVRQSGYQNEYTEIETEIDRLVYDLYGLTEDEIAIVEGTN